MKNWFQVKITYDKTLDNGSIKRVSELYLLDALSWTEAEAKAIEEVKQFIDGDFSIADIKRYKFSELFLSDEGGKFFRAKVMLVMLDEMSGTEKLISAYMLAQAHSIEEAQELIKEEMKDSMSDYFIAEVKETRIVDVFEYNELNYKVKSNATTNN